MEADARWMAMALSEAEKAAAAGEVPVGAVLVQGDRLLWADHNRREAQGDPTAHAEMLCLRQGAAALGNWRLEQCTLYVTLEPCPMCAGAALMSRLGRLVYACSDPEKGCCGSVYDLPADPLLHGCTRWHSGVEEQAAAALLQGFFLQRRAENKTNESAGFVPPAGKTAGGDTAPANG